MGTISSRQSRCRSGNPHVSRAGGKFDLAPVVLDADDPDVMLPEDYDAADYDHQRPLASRRRPVPRSLACVNEPRLGENNMPRTRSAAPQAPAVPVPARRAAVPSRTTTSARPPSVQPASRQSASAPKSRGAASPRKPLSRLTLDDERSLRVASMATDLAASIIGSPRAVTDDEWSNVGRALRDGLGARGVARLHALRSRIARGLGETPFPTDNDAMDVAAGRTDEPIDGDQGVDWSDHRAHTIFHQRPPDRVMTDAVLHPWEDTNSPTASRRRRGAGSPKGADIDVEDPEDVEEDFAENPLDTEGADNSALDAGVDDDLESDLDDEDDDDLEDEEGDEDEDTDEDDDLDDEDDDLDDEDEDMDEDDDLDDEDDDLEAQGPDTESGGEGPEEFTLDDADDLAAAGLDGVLTDPDKVKRASLTRRAEKRRRRSGEQNFRPSRRLYASGPSKDEWESVFQPH
jgi:hypothetical protein